MMKTISKKAPQQPIMQGAVASFEKLQSLPASAVILDPSGTIVAVNDRWKQFGRRNGLRVAHSAIGSNYLQHCRSDEPHLRRFVRELRALLAGHLDLLTFIYPCHSPTQERWFSLIGLPLSLDKPSGVALLHVNITGMLPQRLRRRRTRAAGRPTEHNSPPTHLGSISGAVERSVLETLTSQLNTMLAGPPAQRAAAHRATDQMSLVRTRLSKRQMQVLSLLGEGKTNKEMAQLLFLSPNTIKLHVSAILQRLKLRSRTNAALLSSTLRTHGGVDLLGSDLSSCKKIRAAG